MLVRFKYVFVTFLFFSLSLSNLVAQDNPPVQVDVNVQNDEDDVKKRLLQKGIDVDKLDPSNPADVAKLEKALEEIEAEKQVELEKAQQQAVKETVEEAKDEVEKIVEQEVKEEVNEVASATTEEIAEAVEEGATIEEAIAEGIIEAQEDDLPPTDIYGQHIFRNKDISSFRNANDIVAPDSYMLGSGDKIAISLWGYSELDVVFEINKEGYIKPDGMPRINLKGMSLGRAKDLLRSRFSSYYRFGKDQFEVIVTYPRTITVHIVGEVINSGSFTMPAINTAFNALAAAGGPSNIGSVRNIKLIRSGGDNRVMDVYEYLLDPTITKDYYLRDNDIIHVGVAEKLVSIQGVVRRPFVYELKEEEQLTDLVKYAGGLPPRAYKGNFKVRRFINDLEKIIDVNYNELLSVEGDFELKGGDRVVVKGIPKPYKNFVEISGSVDFPGKYELEGGMKIDDLVKKGILAEGARFDVAYLIRTDVDGTLQYDKINLDVVLKNQQAKENIVLEPKDKLLILSRSKFVDQYQITIKGAVRNPSKYKYNSGDNLTLNDLVTLAGGLREDATNFAYVYRKNLKGSKEKEYVKVDIKNALQNPESIDNLALQPNDQVQVFSLFTFEDEFEVSIAGAVRNPAKYPFDPTNQLRVEDLILLSGGLKRDATDFAYVYRKDFASSQEKEYVRINIKNALENPESGDNLLLQPNDRIEVFSIFNYRDEYNVSVQGAVRNPSTYPFDPTNQLKIEDVVLLSGGLRLDATDFAYVYRTLPGNPKEREYIRINIKNAIESPTSPDNLILQPNDQLQVFSKLSYMDEFRVRVTGEVRSPGEYKYDGSLTLKDVLTLSGGLKLSASLSRIDVFRMVLKEDQPTQSIVATVQVDKDLNMISGNDFVLEPFDLVAVRSIPEFELQKFVRIEGEVKYPGAYAILDDNEKISNVVKRAGGLTKEAFPSGATLFRAEEGTGYVVLRLDKALKNRRDRHNFILKQGDVIRVPKNQDLVSVTGATRANDLYPDNVLNGGKLNVAYNRGKRAQWYVDEYAAGIGNRGKKKLITVEHPNGEIKRTKNFLFFKVTPKVRKGSIVKVGVKPPKPPKEEGQQEREKIDWGEVLADSVAQATAVLSLILLVQRVN